MDIKLLNMAKRHLRKSDNVMLKLIEQLSPITFTKTRQPYFQALVRAIINQQLSVKAGTTIEKRVQLKHGGRYFNAERLLRLRSTTLRQCGLSNNKVCYLRTLAKAIIGGELNFRKLVKLDDDAIRNVLIKFPGIGQWTADMFLITSLQRPDVFPIGDLVLRKSMQRYYQLADDTIYDQYVAIAAAWQPYRTIASVYLWKASH